MGNTEIFEFHETFSKRQCPDCAIYWEIGNRMLHMRKMHAAYGKKSTVERQVIYHKARDMLRKAKLPKNGSCETILKRWHTYSDYKKSISDEGWTEEKIQ